MAVVKALTLQFQPAYMDILPLYIVLLAALPFVLAGFRLWPAVVLCRLLRVCGWRSRLDSRIALAAYPGPNRVWAFNPFGWQALFFLGAWLRVARHPRGDALARPPLAVPAGRGLRVVGFVIRFSWTLHGLYDPIPALASGKLLWPFLSKEDLGCFASPACSRSRYSSRG